MKKMKKQVLLYYCVEMEDVARKIASESDSITLHSINWRFFFKKKILFASLVIVFVSSACYIRKFVVFT